MDIVSQRSATDIFGHPSDGLRLFLDDVDVNCPNFEAPQFLKNLFSSNKKLGAVEVDSNQEGGRSSGKGRRAVKTLPLRNRGGYDGLTIRLQSDYEDTDDFSSESRQNGLMHRSDQCKCMIRMLSSSHCQDALDHSVDSRRRSHLYLQ